MNEPFSRAVLLQRLRDQEQSVKRLLADREDLLKKKADGSLSAAEKNHLATLPTRIDETEKAIAETKRDLNLQDPDNL